jgi:hypothetical protein
MGARCRCLAKARKVPILVPHPRSPYRLCCAISPARMQSLNLDGLHHGKWTRSASRILGEGSAPSAALDGDWGIVGGEARLVYDDQVVWRAR